MRTKQREYTTRELATALALLIKSGHVGCTLEPFETRLDELYECRPTKRAPDRLWRRWARRVARRFVVSSCMLYSKIGGR